MWILAMTSTRKRRKPRSRSDGEHWASTSTTPRRRKVAYSWVEIRTFPIVSVASVAKVSVGVAVNEDVVAVGVVVDVVAVGVVVDVVVVVAGERVNRVKSARG
jgi:hypothetical protein